MSSAATAFVHATLKRSQKVPRAKSGTFGSLGWIPMIQVPFHSSCVALQYKTKSFSIERFQSYTASKIGKFQYNRVVFSTSSRSSVECLVIYPVNTKDGSALQVSRE